MKSTPGCGGIPTAARTARNVWVWRELPEIDLRKHVLRTTLPPGSDLDALWQLVSELHGERLDMDARCGRAT